MTTPGPSYDLYPAVDQDYNFAPEVRVALAASPELRNQAAPMTTTERNNLAGADLWPNRLILNTTTGRINRYDSVKKEWVAYTEASDLVKLLDSRTTGTMRLVARPGDSLGLDNGRGAGVEAARADHTHGLSTRRLVKGQVTIPTETLPPQTTSTTIRTIAMPGTRNASVINIMAHDHLVSCRWFNPGKPDSEIRYWVFRPNGSGNVMDHQGIYPTFETRPMLLAGDLYTGMNFLYYNSTTEVMDYRLSNRSTGTLAVGGMGFRWIAEV